MKEVILCKYGEIILKGANKGSFETILLKELRRRAKAVGNFSVRVAQSTVYIEPESDDPFESDIDAMLEQAKKVFGFVAVTKAAVAEKNIDDICRVAADYLADSLRTKKTFKCEAKRADKKFPMKSPEISAEVGGAILERLPHLRVSLDAPETVVRIEVRDRGAYIHADQTPGAGGIPYGCGGKGLLLLSGGIDSPVAGYMMAKRGLSVDALYFESIPYTSLRAREKVLTLAKKLTEYTGFMRVHIISLTKIQEMIRDNCEEDYFTLILRRFMMRLASMTAEHIGAPVLITGESLGQVASQTTAAICSTEAEADRPVFRPCIGLDKEEIIKISRCIDTFDTSIEPYEDCCTVFTPRHPRTRPELAKVIAAESGLDREALIREAFETRFTVTVRQFEDIPDTSDNLGGNYEL